MCCLYKTHNHVFPGKKNEFCSKDYECQYPLTCVNETCNCPPNTFHVSYNDDSELVHRCIPNGGTFSVTNSVMEYIHVIKYT